jgi:hypothetical protein
MKEVMLLTQSAPQGGLQGIFFVCWFAVPAGKEFPQPNFKSAWPDINTKDGVLQSALQAGSVIEMSFNATVPVSITTAQLQTFLQNWWSSVNSYLSANAQYPGVNYGFFWDGTSWAKA